MSKDRFRHGDLPAVRLDLLRHAGRVSFQEPIPPQVRTTIHLPLAPRVGSFDVVPGPLVRRAEVGLPQAGQQPVEPNPQAENTQPGNSISDRGVSYP